MIKDGKDDDSAEIVTRKIDPISSALAAVAVEYSTLASRAQEASRLVRGASSRDRSLVLRGITTALRNAGDAAHDHARALEEHLASS